MSVMSEMLWVEIGCMRERWCGEMVLEWLADGSMRLACRGIFVGVLLVHVSIRVERAHTLGRP